MELQPPHGPRHRAAVRSMIERFGPALAMLASAGCMSEPTAKPPAYRQVATGPADSSVRMFRSAHHVIYTTFDDDRRLASSIAALEASYEASCRLTGVRPSMQDTAGNVFLFAKRSEWEAFTKSRLGKSAPLYLQVDRGGYTFGRFCAVRDLGERDTLVVLAHEQLHLFIATHFQARPPPFIEEGLATMLERVRERDGAATIDLGRSASREGRFAMLAEQHRLVPLRQLLSMHAGNVVGLTGPEVDAFYSQAWGFVHFLHDGEDRRYRPALERMLNDAASGALSSESLHDDPALVERYLGASLEVIQTQFERYAARLSS